MAELAAVARCGRRDTPTEPARGTVSCHPGRRRSRLSDVGSSCRVCDAGRPANLRETRRKRMATIDESPSMDICLLESTYVNISRGQRVAALMQDTQGPAQRESVIRESCLGERPEREPHGVCREAKGHLVPATQQSGHRHYMRAAREATAVGRRRTAACAPARPLAGSPLPRARRAAQPDLVPSPLPPPSPLPSPPLPLRCRPGRASLPRRRASRPPPAAGSARTCGRDAACPISKGQGARRVHLV